MVCTTRSEIRPDQVCKDPHPEQCHFLWVCGGSFTPIPILIQYHKLYYNQIACVHNRAYLVAGSGELLQWNIFAWPEEHGAASLSSQISFSNSLRHAEFTSIPLPASRSVSGIAANKRNVIAIDDSGCIWSMPYDLPGYWSAITLPISSSNSVMKVSCGAAFVLALTNSGQVYSWGNALQCLGRSSSSSSSNAGLEIGVVESIPERVVDIYSGSHHSLAITDIGSLYSWGINKQGCLGIGSEYEVAIDAHRVRIDSESPVLSASCGYYHSACVTSDGDLFGWGNNEQGQIGLCPTLSWIPSRISTVTFKAAFVECGAFHTAVISDLQQLYTFGLNSSGQLGLGDFMARNEPAMVDCLSGKQVVAVSCGGSVTIALTNRIISFDSSECHFGIAASADTGMDDPKRGDAVVFQELPNRKRCSADISSQSALSRMSTVFRRYVPPEADSSNQGQPLPERVKEVQKISQMYREKLMKDSQNHAMLQWKASTILQEADRERDRLIESRRLRDEALESTVNVWLTEIIPSFSKKRTQKRTLDLIYKAGVPPRLRSLVWPRAIANSLLINTELFSVFSNRAHAIHEQIVAQGQLNGASGLAVGRENTIYYIEVDLPRTFPTLAFFRRGQPLHSELCNLLQTYCCYRPDVGYVQGMSYLAGSLLLYLDPYTAFTLFANLLALPFMHAFVRIDSVAMNAQYHVHLLLLESCLPRLFEYFSSIGIGVSPQLYILEWFMTLFTKRLNLNTAARAWDLIFTQIPHELAVHKIALAILQCLQDKLLAESFDGCMSVLNNDVQNITGDELMTAVANIRVPRSIISQIEQLALPL